MGMVGRIAYCISDDLITRVANMILKECRHLILVLRETDIEEQMVKVLVEKV
jgi:3-polyprenyl-4-hydroxybenzoate decarboxylase